MADTATPPDATLDPAAAPVPDPAVEVVPADTPPPADGTVYVVGYVGTVGVSTPILSASAEPEDDTEVWLASDPEDRGPLNDKDDEWGGPDGNVGWLAEPVPYDPTNPEGGGTPPAEAMPAEAPAPEAMVAAADAPEDDALAEAEAKLAGLEGLVAGILLDTLEDERFVDDDPDHDDDSDLPGQQARVAATARAYLNATLAHTAAADPEAEFAEGGAEGDGVTLDAEKDPDESGTTDDTDEDDDRLTAVTERIAKLEATIADIMENTLDDEEMIDEDDVDGDLSTVDERDDDKSKG